MKTLARAVVSSALFLTGMAVAAEQESTSTDAVDVPASTPHAQQLGEFIVVGQALPDASSEPKPADKDLLDRYLPYEQRVAGWVDNTARGIDRFFGSDDAWRVDNDSWLRVTNDLRWEQDQGAGFELRPRLKLDLPTASKRLHLLIENDSPEQRSAAEESNPALRNTDQSRTTVFGLGANLDRWAPAWKKQIQGGVRVALPIELYARFIARRSWDLDESWQLESYNRFSWFEQDGYAANARINIGEPLTPKLRLYYTTDLTWKEKRDYLQFAETANLAHILSSRSAITYSLGVAGTGLQGPQINAYFLTADYRRNIFRRIVFFDVIPEFSLPREYDFDPHWAITLRLELYFQKQVETGE
ncbi:MAG TPA: hypothetical protein VFM32_08775 [Spongiibacteraceae bacterium]|nr:hypothetical protein [Spongiibacteraceae bacterium]